MKSKLNLKSKLILLPVLSLLLSCAQADEAALLLPENLIIIGEEAFCQDLSVAQVVVPHGTEEIGPRAFAGSGLTGITLPDSVTSIDETAFAGCSGLVITAPEGSYAHIWALERGYAAAVPDAAEYSYTLDADGEATLTSYLGSDAVVLVPETIDGYPVESIGTRAFAGNTTVSAVSLPDSVAAIGYSAFDGCSSLTRIDMPAQLDSIGGNAFRACVSLESIAIPDRISFIGLDAFDSCTRLSSVRASIGTNGALLISAYGLPFTDPDHPQFRLLQTASGRSYSLGVAGWSGTESELFIPSALDGTVVASIEEAAFAGCSFLTLVHLPASLTSIAPSAFSGCSGVTFSVVPGSPAESWCTGNGLPCICESVS